MNTRDNKGRFLEKGPKAFVQLTILSLKNISPYKKTSYLLPVCLLGLGKLVTWLIFYIIKKK